jgi:hypothetical protein|tara:strand:- start:2221 stop:2595 length:375 start_codon:yes stop_codon:yes gene_type:complete
MARTKSHTVAGTSKEVRRGPISVNQMKNGEEILQYHQGRLKIIRKEFGKLFELEFSSPELREVKTFAKFSDVKKPQKNAVRIFKGGVRVAEGQKFFASVPESGNANTQADEFEQSADGTNVIPK